MRPFVERNGETTARARRFLWLAVMLFACGNQAGTGAASSRGSMSVGTSAGSSASALTTTVSTTTVASADAGVLDATVPEIDAIAPSDSSTGGEASGPADGSSDTGTDGARESRCDDAGRCTCFNVASLGYGGSTGAQSGSGGTDNTRAFLSYLNVQSSTQAIQLGCGTDTGCSSPAEPAFDAAFLAHYDVLILQWMANSLHTVTISGSLFGFTGAAALGGGGYWSFTQAQLDAIKAWVSAGGGLIVLSGYDFCPNATYSTMCGTTTGEIGPSNQILQGIGSGMAYTAADTYGATETGNGFACLGFSNAVTGWTAAPDIPGEHIMQVGAFHGRGISTGSNSVIDCTNSTYGVCAAHEDIGAGHVYVFTDEWMTYTSQWNPSPQIATYCLEDAGLINPVGCNGPCSAPQVYYQGPQFWYNALSYASQATGCAFALSGAIAR